MEMAVELMEMAPGAIPRPGRVPEQRLSVPRILSAMVAALRNVSWTEADYFRVFVLERIYRRKRRREGVPEGPTPCPGVGQARPGRALGEVCSPRGAPPTLLLAPGVFLHYRISVIFLVFSKHFHFWTFSTINRHNK